MTSRANVCALIFAIVCPTVVTLAYFVFLAGHPLGKISYAIGKTVQFGFPLFWVVLICRERLHITKPSMRGVPLGLAFGFAVAGSMLVLYWSFLKPAEMFLAPAEAVRNKVAQMGLDTVAKFAAAGVFYSLCHSLLEEYYWRWFVFGRLRALVPLTPAVVISSLGFMAHHVILLAVYFGPASFVTYLFSLAIAVGGAVWALIYHRSDSLYGPWVSHLLVDSAIFIVGFDLLFN